ncbi:MAG TPA: MBL fold metallo-hydrolase [Patescibacteria group bacterium]|nr:MBL fold metallo-hydrolase [Patescibacteria group bacterium]
MQITWHGFSCFRIQETIHGHDVSIVIDPFEPEEGLKLPRNLAADLVISSHDHDRHNNVAAVGGTPFVITGPGEYEVKDAFVTGIPTYHDLVEGKEKGINTMFYITVGDIHIVHLGDLKHPLEEKHMEEFHEIDVLFVPVGGGGVLTGKQAAEVVAQLEPRIIIPMHYKTGAASKLEPVDAFLKAMAIAKPAPLPKLKIAAKDLPQEETQVIILEPQ